MKRKLNLLFASSLLVSSGISIVGLTINSNNTNNINAKVLNPCNFNGNVDIKTATKYANETSIVTKSLLIGKNKGFNTDNLLNNMFSKIINPDINNLTGDNTGDDFINNWTNNLDGNSINAIQSLFERNGVNQPTIDNIHTNISNYQSYKNYLPTIKQYLKNGILSSESTANMLQQLLQLAKTFVPNIDDYLDYAKYAPTVSNTVQALITDWDQPQDFSGDNPLDKMKDYMAKKGTISEAWNTTKNGNWYYVASRAGNWNWNDFYQYMAGVNFNYLFKLVSGKYIGDMISENVHLSWLSFDSDTFTSEFSAAIDKIKVNLTVWPYLIKTMVPILKTQLLPKLVNPTLGVNSITWDNSNLSGGNKTVGIKQLLTAFQNLISSKDGLLQLVSKLITGPFGEDIIIKVTPIWIDSYYTLPEIKSKYGFISAIRDIPQKVVTALNDVLKNVPINDFINKTFIFTSKYLVTNPIIDLKYLSTYLNLTFGSKEFVSAIGYVKDLIDHPTNPSHTIKEILALLGVQFNGEPDFKKGSFFASIQNWINTPNSSLNKIISVFIGNKQNPGIIDKMLEEQNQLYEDSYSKYFDMTNSTYFTLSNIEMNKYQHDDNSIHAVLTYKIKNKLDNTIYDVTFSNDNFANAKSKNFKLTSFHLSS